jgi:hypothetical protein
MVVELTQTQDLEQLLVKSVFDPILISKHSTQRWPEVEANTQRRCEKK